MSRPCRLSCVVVAALCLVLSPTEAARQCVGRDQCSCVYTDDQSAIILNSLGNSDLTPKFMDVKAPDGNTYSYNPCYPFVEKECNNAAVCMTNQIGATTVIGDSQTATFSADDSGLSVGYTAGTGIITVSQITLVCDTNACEPQLTSQGQIGMSTYGLTLASVCACPNGCDEKGPLQTCGSSASGSNAGYVVLGIMLGLIVAYIVGGILYMKFVRKAHGYELIPNVDFWKSFPSLVKAGVMFAISPCTKKSGYSST